MNMLNKAMTGYLVAIVALCATQFYASDKWSTFKKAMSSFTQQATERTSANLATFKNKATDFAQQTADKAPAVWADFKGRAKGLARQTPHSTPAIMYSVAQLAPGKITERLERAASYSNQSPFQKINEAAVMWLPIATVMAASAGASASIARRSTAAVKAAVKKASRPHMALYGSSGLGAMAAAGYNVYQAHNPSLRRFYINPKESDIYDLSFVQEKLPQKQGPYPWSRSQPLPGSIPVIYKPEALSSFLSEETKPAEFYVKDPGDAEALKKLSAKLARKNF